jgi:hypothetical protein
VKLRGGRLTDLARARACHPPIRSVNTIFANRRFRFHKLSQLFIRTRKQHSAPSFLLASRCLPAVAHQQRIRPWCTADFFRRSACDCAQVLFEIFKTHRCEFLAFVWLRHRPAPFRVPSNRPAATTDIAIAPSATAQSRIMIRWSLFVIAPPELGFRQEIG